ncbi:MAG: RloB family protein [Magnetococcus sp. YQC-3]
MTRPPPTPPKLARKQPSREPPKTRLVIVSEGKNTEPVYIRAFALEHGFSADRLDFITNTSTPKSIVDRAVQEKESLARERRRGAHEIWAVFDRDEHPQIEEAKQKARDNDIGIAFSNPCVELWALYHFHDCHAHTEHGDMPKALKKAMPEHDPDGRKLFDYEQMRTNYQTARKRAEKGRAAREKEGTPHGNPSTSMDLLTEQIVALAKQ